MSKNYKIYMHLFPNGKRYIGMTMKSIESRRRSGYGHNKYMTNAILKYGWDNIKHIILCEGLTKTEAETKEVEFISKYKSNIREYGYNIANGGNSSGMVSEETKKIMSKKAKGKNNPMYGVIGRNHPKAVSVNQYDLNGNHIKTWDCMLDIERELGITMKSISQNCRGKCKSIGGYQWRYYKGDTNDIQPYKIKSQKGKCNPMYGVIGDKNKRSKPVGQYSLEGEIIRTFDSMTIASKETGISIQSISACCVGSAKTGKGYIWKYV